MKNIGTSAVMPHARRTFCHPRTHRTPGGQLLVIDDDAGSTSPLQTDAVVWYADATMLVAADGRTISTGIADHEQLAMALARHFDLDAATAAAAANAMESAMAWPLPDGRRLIALNAPPDVGTRTASVASAVNRTFALLHAAPSAKPTIATALECLGPELRLGPSLVFWKVDSEGRFLRGERDERGALLSLDEILSGRTLSEAFPTSDHRIRESIERVTNAIRSGASFQGLQLLLPATSDLDSPTEWQISGYPLRNDEDIYAGAVGLAIDDGFTRFLEAAPLPAVIWEWAENPKIISSNRAMREMTGLSNNEINGLTIDELARQTEAELEHETYGLGRMDGARLRVRHAGTGRWEQRTIVTRHFLRPSGECALAFYVDITEPLDREQIERARAFARVSSSIAHDVGNTITVLDSMLACLVESDRETRIELTEDMQETVNRMKQLLERLKRLSIGASEDGEAAEVLLDSDPEAEIERIVRLFQRLHPGIELSRDSEREDSGQTQLRLPISPLDFERTLMNLLVNAAAASGPDCHIRLSSRTDRTSTRAFWELTIEDNGPGFPNVPGHVLMKPGISSRGSGLGLFQVEGMVRSLGGNITLGRSDALGGARVHMRLPTS